jgi:hypothetical protein
MLMSQILAHKMLQKSSIGVYFVYNYEVSRIFSSVNKRINNLIYARIENPCFINRTTQSL